MIFRKLILCSLLLLAFNTFFAQNTITIEVENEDTDLVLEYEDGDLVLLKIDGEVIPKKDYNKHQELIDSYRNRSAKSSSQRAYEKAAKRKEIYLKQREYDKAHDVSRDSNDDLAKQFEAILNKEDLLFDPAAYTLNLSKKMLKINGNKMPQSLKNELSKVAFDIVDINESDNYIIKIKVKKGSRSISVNVEN